MRVNTNKRREVIDITDRIARQLPTGKGAMNIFVKHTTAVVTTADLDPGTDEDLLSTLEDLLPQNAWLHPHDSSYEHVSAHLLASIIGPNINVPYENGTLCLGAWQRIILVELDGPREREVVVTALERSAAQPADGLGSSLLL